jgi:hypothetical protein
MECTLPEHGADGEFFKEYHVRISPRERSIILDKLDKDVLEFQHGFELGPSYVRHIYDDPEYKNRWTGKNCFVMADIAHMRPNAQL